MRIDGSGFIFLHEKCRQDMETAREPRSWNDWHELWYVTYRSLIDTVTEVMQATLQQRNHHLVASRNQAMGRSQEKMLPWLSI